MITKEELTKKFKSLYDYMAVSNEPKYMMLFGDVMKCMMEDAINNNTSKAEEWIDKLEAIKWKEYLSKAEATKIVSEMNPKAPWTFDAWLKAMEDLGLEYKREGVFNCYALWTVMNAVHSDDGKTIASLMGIDYGNAASNPEYIKTVYQFAMNKLQDADMRYNVRHYFIDK